MTYYLSRVEFRRMFPRLSDNEAELLYSEITSPDMMMRLEELKARCTCIAGAVFCMCGKSAALSPVERVGIEPLVRAWARGADPLPVGGS
jgi:hypothetical protein